MRGSVLLLVARPFPTSLTPVPEAVEHGARPGPALPEELDRARRLPSARSGITGLAVTGPLRLVRVSESLPTPPERLKWTTNDAEIERRDETLAFLSEGQPEPVGCLLISS
jgi:hypothetical protein